MNMELYRITDLTAVHDFPAIHNHNVQELEAEIARLHQEISEKNALIDDIKAKFNSALNALRAEYIAKIEDLKSKIEEN